jgi:hypothetical protein
MDFLLGGQGLGRFNLTRLDINPHYLAGGDGLRQPNCDSPGTAPIVQDPHARPQIGQEKGGVSGCGSSAQVLGKCGSVAVSVSLPSREAAA